MFINCFVLIHLPCSCKRANKTVYPKVLLIKELSILTFLEVMTEMFCLRNCVKLNSCLALSPYNIRICTADQLPQNHLISGKPWQCKLNNFSWGTAQRVDSLRDVNKDVLSSMRGAYESMTLRPGEVFTHPFKYWTWFGSHCPAERKRKRGQSLYHKYDLYINSIHFSTNYSFYDPTHAE